MSAAPLHFGTERLMLDPSGAAWWPAERTLLVADLHFEKSTAFALRGALLPPYDTRATLDRLTRLVRLYRPAEIVCLGDSFHDSDGASRLAPDNLARIEAIARDVRFVWITGNHDPSPTGLPGIAAREWRVGNFVFRHQATKRLTGPEIEVSGHFHPKACVPSRARPISRPCFVTDPQRLILPAFGAYTGGLDVRDPAICRLFPRGLRVFLLGEQRLFSFSLGQLGQLAAAHA